MMSGESPYQEEQYGQEYMFLQLIQMISLNTLPTTKMVTNSLMCGAKSQCELLN